MTDEHREPQHLFVYGTLMSAFRDTNPVHNETIARHARFAGFAMLRGARLYDVGRYPAAVRSASPDDVVYGELYQFDIGSAGDLLDTLDEYEECEGYLKPGSIPLYQRQAANVQLVTDSGGTNKSLTAWVYWWSSRRTLRGLTHIVSGRYGT